MEYPIDKYLKVIEGVDIRKSGKWWTAIVKVCPNDRLNSVSIRLYRWRNSGGQWKKVSSFNINRGEDWIKIKSIVDKMFEL